MIVTWIYIFKFIPGFAVHTVFRGPDWFGIVNAAKEMPIIAKKITKRMVVFLFFDFFYTDEINGVFSLNFKFSLTYFQETFSIYSYFLSKLSCLNLIKFAATTK